MTIICLVSYFLVENYSKYFDMHTLDEYFISIKSFDKRSVMA